ncbi:hypothetical protein, partial [Rhodopirellula bahusiensis]
LVLVRHPGNPFGFEVASVRTRISNQKPLSHQDLSQISEIIISVGWHHSVDSVGERYRQVASYIGNSLKRVRIAIWDTETPTSPPKQQAITKLVVDDNRR